MHTPLLLFLGDLGGSEVMLILVVVLIFFGAKRIPELARGLGKGVREFKDATSGIRSEIENAGLPAPALRYPPAQPAPYVPYPAPEFAPQPQPPVSPIVSSYPAYPSQSSS